MSNDISLVVAFADCHVNSVEGLCPPYLTIDSGGSYRANSAQRVVWNRWLHFWDIIEAKKREHRATLYVLSVGDAGDRNTHDGAGLISRAESDEVRFVVKAFRRPAELADYFFMIRGTEAHTGPRAAIEELAAKELGCIQDMSIKDEEGNGRYSWRFVKLEASGLLFNVAHHPKTTGRLPWTRQAAAARHSAIIRHRHFDLGKRVPDVAIRAHAHYGADSGNKTQKPLFIQLPPWQLTTMFGDRLGSAGDVEPVGAAWFLCQNERLIDWDMETYVQREKKPWNINSK